MGKTVLWTCLSLLCFFSSAFAGTITGHVECRGAKTNPWAVVYVDQISGQEFPPPAEHALMDQVAKEFVPHVLPVLQGTTVDFQNSDPFKHNVFSPDEAADEFNLGSWGQGEKRSHTFHKTGEAVMLCDLHPEMEGWIVVLPTPYFAVTDGDGNYVIQDVPAGAYTLKTWHKKLKPAEAPVTVLESGESSADFTLKK